MISLFFLFQILHFLFLLPIVYLALFSTWKILEREHIDEVSGIFDRLLSAAALALYLARIPDLIELFLRSHIALPASLNPFIGAAAWQITIVLFLVFFYNFLRQNWRDRFALLDYCVIPLSLFLSGIFLGETVFTALQNFTDTKAISVVSLLFNIVETVAFFGLSRLLAYFEVHYRTYFWYRDRRSSAQTGFVTAIFLIAAGIIGMVEVLPALPFALLSVPLFLVFWSLFTAVGGFILLYVRSGRLKKR